MATCTKPIMLCTTIVFSNVDYQRDKRTFAVLMTALIIVTESKAIILQNTDPNSPMVQSIMGFVKVVNCATLAKVTVNLM